MNYRHAFHAGNFADVLKHTVLSLLIEHMKKKGGAFLVLDTHAGIGRYDLASDEALRTGEWQGGIGRVLHAAEPPVELADYLGAIRAINPDGSPRWYPGSPALAAALIRPQDRLALVELHPEDNETLRRYFRDDGRVGVHRMDGYAALKALLPPPERRGLVLIDPPYEVSDEVARLRSGLRQALERWPTGIYALWYPIKARSVVERFHADLVMLGLPKTLACEILIDTGDDPQRLNGCGLVIINPPWRLDRALATVLPWLTDVLAAAGAYRLDWLVGETGD